TDSKVVFSAPGQCGDSGGPVYLMQSDGTATAVGIDIRGFNPGKPDAGCSAPAKFSVAELAQPWLDKWSLTAVTTPPAAAR
ncbi:MAG TPA: endopeptidase, partial [Mycobacterium sp.]|nr:endopeptidase [Mycobacterium sp.]